MNAEKLKIQSEIAAALIRSGFTPSASLAAAGMDPIEHTGLQPVTVKQKENE